MARARPPYPPEFREQIVELARNGRSMADLAREFEPTYETIRKWVRQARQEEAADADGLDADEQEELKRLRQENRKLRQEREILAKATAWFARETDSTSRRSTSS
jgi:transposase